MEILNRLRRLKLRTIVAIVSVLAMTSVVPLPSYAEPAPSGFTDLQGDSKADIDILEVNFYDFELDQFGFLRGYDSDLPAPANTDLYVSVKFDTVIDSKFFERFEVVVSLDFDQDENIDLFTYTPTPEYFGSVELVSGLETWQPAFRWDQPRLECAVFVRTARDFKSQSLVFRIPKCGEFSENFGVKVDAYSSTYKEGPADSAPDWTPGGVFQQVSNPVFLPVVPLGPRPQISGKAFPGQNLVATISPWTSGTQFSWEWFADGVPIPAATKTRLAVTAALAGKSLTVKVTGELEDFRARHEVSAPVKVGYLKLSKTPTPELVGKLKKGSSVSAKVGVWDSGVKLEYQWKLNGLKVIGATKSKYSIGIGDVGKKLTLTITATKSGYQAVSKTSASKVITK